MKDILIVEDGRQERERLHKLFQDAGYSVVACEGVNEAEDCLKRERCRLAVLDIGLNDRSGSYLFNSLIKSQDGCQIIIFTGNPSVHLKQRFLEGGAVDYIVKASPQAKNESFLSRVRELLGEPTKLAVLGIPLEQFLNSCVSESSRELFLDADGEFPPCSNCGSRRYVVTFSQKPQMPPEVEGVCVCESCGSPLDGDIK
ncbi:MAG: response regulator [Bdellovibrionales bacterium]|nr:response regulator [Bdellovibrionales bacterium]